MTKRIIVFVALSDRDDCVFLDLDEIVAIRPARDPGTYCVDMRGFPDRPVLIKETLESISLVVKSFGR